MYPAKTLTAVIYHDLVEDYPEQAIELQRRCQEDTYVTVCRLDKTGKSPEQYFGELALDCVGSIAKGGDRSHNIQTMSGVFSPEKQLAYADEVELWFLPMLKTARRAFPQQEPAYENIKHLLVSQIELIRVKQRVSP
jgi:(p)ppGpp synthase/HD superfamily hydrolase